MSDLSLNFVSQGNVMGVFFAIAAQNAVTFLTAFLEDLPLNNGPGLPTPNDFSPGEGTTGLLGLLSFWQPELEALKTIMNDGEPEELVSNQEMYIELILSCSREFTLYVHTPIQKRCTVGESSIVGRLVMLML